MVRILLPSPCRLLPVEFSRGRPIFKARLAGRVFYLLLLLLTRGLHRSVGDGNPSDELARTLLAPNQTQPPAPGWEMGSFVPAPPALVIHSPPQE